MTTTIETISVVLSSASYGVYHDDVLGRDRFEYNGTVYDDSQGSGTGDTFTANDGNSYELVMVYKDPNGSGYEGALYKNSNGDYFRSHSGTEITDTGDIYADIQIGLKNLPEDQVDAMLAFDSQIRLDFAAKSAPVPEMTEVGHSLGGAMAQIAGMIYGNEVIACPAPVY